VGIADAEDDLLPAQGVELAAGAIPKIFADDGERKLLGSEVI
jgi:hypothetical protein